MKLLLEEPAQKSCFYPHKHHLYKFGKYQLDVIPT